MRRFIGKSFPSTFHHPPSTEEERSLTGVSSQNSSLFFSFPHFILLYFVYIFSTPSVPGLSVANVVQTWFSKLFIQRNGPRGAADDNILWLLAYFPEALTPSSPLSFSLLLFSFSSVFFLSVPFFSLQFVWICLANFLKANLLSAQDFGDLLS